MQTTLKRMGRIVLLIFLLGKIAASGTPVRASGNVLYAAPTAQGTGDCSSWANACTLSKALQEARSGDEIWVQEGTHKPDTSGLADPRTATFQLVKEVAVYGGFAGTETSRDQRDWQAHPTILSGDIGTANDNSDNVYHVVTGADSATLDGFTVTGGNANGSGDNGSGGGMYNYNSSPTLRNITLSNNSAKYSGGMYNYKSSPTLTNVTFNNNSALGDCGGMLNRNSSPTLTNVTFEHNSASHDGGGMYNYESSPTLTNVTFEHNSASLDGGGVYNYASSPTLTNVTFNSNSGGGMYNYYSSPSLKNVTFSNNSTISGGGMDNSNSSPTLTNVTFSNNSAYRGSGMYNYKSNPTLTNVTFSNNSANHSGGGMYNNNSRPTLTNVTFSNNSAYRGGGMYNYKSSPTLTNVLIAGSSAHGGDCVNDATSSLNANSKNNLIDDNAHACGLTDGTNGNIIGHDAKVGPLGNYGGETQTVPLLAGSPAIDAGDDSACPATDQRGVARPQGSHCDIGAYERDDTNPEVTSITRADASPTNATEVHFTVAFSEAVTGVDTADFSLTTTGSITGASVTAVADTGDQQHFTVTVNTGSGDGTLRLDVPTTATITDLAGNALTGLPYTSGVAYTLDKTPPAEAQVNLQTAYTGEGPSQIEVAFNEAVYDPIGDIDPNDVTNPANYMLVEQGNNGTFDTISCAGGVQPDDAAIAIDRVTYNASTFTSTLYLNGGQPLPPGHYRLLVCGTTSITDLSGNHLNGGASDAITEFTVLPKALPSTGFAPGRVTLLPAQPEAKAYNNGLGLWLEIPSLGLQAPIVGIPQAGGQWDITWLGDEIGWLEGTAFPTWTGNAVLTGHVTNADGLPGPFAQLHTLRYDDAIIVHLAGQRYEFRVREVRLVRPNDTRYALKHLTGYPYLTLVTCRGYDPAKDTYHWRWIVRAVLVAVTADLK